MNEYKIWRVYGRQIAHFRSAQRIGRMSELIWKFLPKTKEEWWYMYTHNEGGRSEEYIHNIAKEMSTIIPVPEEKCYEDLKDIICQTFDGYLTEKNIMDILSRYYKKVEHADEFLDRNGVDIIIYNNDYNEDDDEATKKRKIAWLVQVKPSNFFRGDASNNKQLREDRIKLLNQANYFNNLYNNRYRVIVYEPRNQSNVCHTLFSAGCLLEADGRSKNIKFNFE